MGRGEDGADLRGAALGRHAEAGGGGRGDRDRGAGACSGGLRRRRLRSRGGRRARVVRRRGPVADAGARCEREPSGCPQVAGRRAPARGDARPCGVRRGSRTRAGRRRPGRRERGGAGPRPRGDGRELIASSLRSDIDRVRSRAPGRGDQRGPRSRAGRGDGAGRPCSSHSGDHPRRRRWPRS